MFPQMRAAVLATGRGPFLERGYTATTIDEIAAAGGISKLTVFTAVGNKAQLCCVRGPASRALVVSAMVGRLNGAGRSS
jgi:AcrR family transcriptional regulator